MEATSDEAMEDYLLSGFDQIYEEVKGGIMEMQSLLSDFNLEVKKREALETACNNLKQENERLAKLNRDSLNSLADQIDWRAKCQNLKEELKRLNDLVVSKEDGQRKAMELLRKDCSTKIGELEAKLQVFLIEKATYEATISHLHQDLAAHRDHIQILANKLDQAHFDVEAKYNVEIQDLKDCLMIEQEEKNELNRKVQNLEKELVVSRAKLAEQQQDTASNWHVETLKQKIMKLRKDNEILKRKLSQSEKG